jgi:CRP-like cAMP-binding protein
MREDSQHQRLLSGLTSEQTRLVLRAATRRKFRANYVIVHGGNPATNLFQITEGTVKYYRLTKKGDEVLLWLLAPDDAFGIGSLLTTTVPYIGTAQAIDDCEILVWSRESIRALAAKYERLAENALHLSWHYLDGNADRLVRLATETAEQRLAKTLLQLSQRTGRVRFGAVEIAITNEDVGGLSSVSVFTASRLLKKWERQGLIEKSRGKIRILRIDGLLID